LLFRENGAEVATVGPGDKVEIKPVTLGRNLGTQFEILKGFTTSDRIIDSPSDSLATGDTVHLAMRRGDQIVYVAKLDGRKAYQMRSHVGLSIPLHCTAVGKAILAATAPDEVRATVTRTGLPARTEHTITSADALAGHLETIRTQGYAVDDQENEASIRCIGAAVTGQHGQPVAAISVSSLTYDLTGPKITRYAQLMTSTARQVSHALGSP